MSKVIQHIGIIGSGNVAWHLAHHLKTVGISIDWIYSRNQETGIALATSIHSTFEKEIPSKEVDLVLICVTDDAIQLVLNQLNDSFQAAYTSGTKPLNELEFNGELGVFYPLQTFSREREIELKEVPFFIESTTSTFAQALFDLAWKISSNVQFASSEDRKKLHLAAVMVNNFSNHLVFLAKTYLDEKGLNWEHLKPLIVETAAKLANISPFEAQTGPARRGDEVTIEKQEAMLEGTTKIIYELITKSIQSTYPKK